SPRLGAGSQGGDHRAYRRWRRLAERGPSRFEAGDGDAERRAGDVVQAHLVEEVHRGWVAAVLTADPELEAGASGAAFLRGDADQPSHPVDVQRLERGDAEHSLLQVGGEEGGFHVVAGEAPGGLGEVVGAEGE